MAILVRNLFLAVPVLASALVLVAGAQPLPEDALLYFRRTHAGAWPLPGINPSEHSNETTHTAPPPIPAPPGLTPSPLLDNGVDPAHLGKGDWIWQLPQTESNLGVPDVQGVIDYETNLGMAWISVKCGDGGSIWAQFNSDLVVRAHAAGLKIFGWAYAYGNNVSAEINVALNALALGADGFIIDAESEYEVLANNDAAAAAYCQGIRASYPNRFLAHAPFPYINLHSGFPYATFGTNCDAVMPQAYWGAIGVSPATMVSDLNRIWINWQHSLSGSNTNAIKPIAPLGQSYAPVTGADITAFLYALSTNTPMATSGGYAGVSFWDAQSRTPDMTAAIGAASFGANSQPPVLLAQPFSRAVDEGGSTRLAGSAIGTAPLSYQWMFNGGAIANATNGTLLIQNAQTNFSGNYSVIVTNAFGSVTSQPAQLLVYPLQTVVFADAFDTNSSGRWTLNTSSSDNRVVFGYDYSALGIPSAPHSAGATTLGLRLEANLTLGAVAAVSLSPAGQRFAGDCRLHIDMWINAAGPFPAGGNGSTEFLTAGLGTTGNQVEWTGPGSVADGYYFSVDGEGGVSSSSTTTGDYCAYIGAALQSPATGVYAAGMNTAARDNSSALCQAVFPVGQKAPALQQANYPAYQTGAMNPGTAGFAWHDLIVSRRGDRVDWVIDGYRFATISNATFGGSNVFFGFWDPFPSLSANTNLSFGLVDNLRVEVPAVAPAFALQPRDVAVKVGGLAGFTASASGVPAPGYQWRYNNIAVAEATNASYVLTNVQSSQAGTYSVTISNLAGFVTSSNATLTVLPASPAQFQQVALQPDQTLHVIATGDAGATYVVESSTNLLDWIPFASLSATNGIFVFDVGVTTNAQRFFRARSGP